MKPLVLRFSLIFACLLFLVLAGCKDGSKKDPASLLGTYSVEENGKLKEFVRIARNGDTYLLSEKLGIAWLPPVNVRPAGNQEVVDILGTPVTGISTGLGDREIAVLQVPKGWKLGDFECKTGFLLVSAFGPLELHKS